MSKHTPGPWTARTRTDVPTGFVIFPPGKDEYGCAIVPANRRAPDEVAANAALIAAAPDLLAALKEMVTWMPSGFAPQSQSIAMKMAHDAIAKAEGVS